MKRGVQRGSRGAFVALCGGALAWALGVMGPAAILSSRAVVEAQASPPATDDRILERTLARAESELARGRTRQGLALLRRAVLRAPTDARAPLRLAGLLLPAELPERADTVTVASAEEVRSACEGAASATGIDVTTKQRLERLAAWARAVGGDRAGAIDALASRCGRLDEDAALLLRKLAAELARAEQLLEAETALLHATRCAAQLIAPLSELGAVRLARGRTTEAIETFREVVRRLPGDADALRDLAGALLADGQARDALALYAAVTSTCPTRARCQLDLARAALEAQEPLRAVTAAREALRLDGRDPAPALLLAAAQLATNQRAQAAEAYREALRRHPGDVRATEGLRALDAPTEGAAPDGGNAL
jgi:tetratricopeptide (TPR) repeat protein